MINLDDALLALDACDDLAALDTRHQQRLGKSGALTLALKNLKNLSLDEKKSLGPQLSGQKSTLESKFTEKKSTLESAEIQKNLDADPVDRSFPVAPETGHRGLVTQTRRKLEDTATAHGFQVFRGQQLVSVFQNFESVNIPLTHPATELFDTFYSDTTDERGHHHCLRTHTSAFQNQGIKLLGAPCKFAVIGKVMRNENLDATHDMTFYQMEGVCISENTTLGDCITATKTFVRSLVGDVKMRVRPAYFPFVEPGFELDILRTRNGKSKRLEILGAGMIHPEVLRQADIDPEKFQGYAFGIGVERMILLEHQIPDIRLFTHGDLRFARSF